MSEYINSKERNKIMDIMKGLGIIYVVLGHTLVNPLHDFIYLFHMPLFYFVSGYLFDEKYSSAPLSLIKSRLKSLYFPFLKYELLFLLLHNIFYYLNIYSDRVTSDYGIVTFYSYSDFFRNFLRILTFSGTEQLLGALWFLWVLFLINIIFCTIRYFFRTILKIQSEIPIAISILFLFIVGNIISYLKIPIKRNIDISLMSILFLYIGFLYKKAESRISLKYLVFFICFLILCIGSMFSNSKILSNVYLKPIFSIIFVFSGIYANLYISKLLSKKNIKLLIDIGNNTIIIMSLHFLCFKLINLYQISWYNFPVYMLAKFPVLYANNGWWILYSFVGVFIPLFLIKLYYFVSSFLKRVEINS